MPQYPEAHLGDGVYASFDGYHIILDLRAQDSSRIALEPEVFNALLKYRESLVVKTGEENVQPE